MGIGTQTFSYMQSVCPGWKEISLITPADKEQNVKFYTEKCGFNISGREMDGNVEAVRFIMKR